MTTSGSKGESPKHDLEERTAKFGEAIIAFAKKVPVNLVTTPLIPQFVDSGTSVGSNYCEADDAGSKKEFLYRISLCKRESRETKHWLRMIVAAENILRDDVPTPSLPAEAVLANAPARKGDFIIVPPILGGDAG